MEEKERFGGGPGGLFWGIGPFATAPNGVGYGFTYPGMAPFWGFGLEPNLWADANIPINMEEPVMRNHMNYMPNQMKSIDMLYPKCYRMLYESVYRECNMFLNNNNGVMPNKIAKEEFCKMAKNCTIQIMNNEDLLIERLNESWICSRDDEENLEENAEDTRHHIERYGNVLLNGIIGILLIQELRRRGCMYCY